MSINDLNNSAEGQLIWQLELSQKSKIFLDNPAVDKFFSEVELRAFKKADELPLSDTVGRDRAYFVIHLSRKFRKALEQYVTNGELAERQMNELLEDKKKKSFLGGLLGD